MRDDGAVYDPFDDDDPEALAAQLQAGFEKQYEELQDLKLHHCRTIDPDLTTTYEPQFQHLAGKLGYDHLPLIKQLRIEFEHHFQEHWVEPRRKEGVAHFYKGTTRRWLVGDDHLPDDQKEILQTAIRAPSVEDTRAWEIKGKIPMQVPFTNENVSKWRDDALATDTVDFSPSLIQYDMEKGKRSYFERFEELRQLE